MHKGDVDFKIKIGALEEELNILNSVNASLELSLK